MNIDGVHEQLAAVGAEHFGANLRKGQIFWTNSKGVEVCSGRCQAILSFAGTNQSLLWCAANTHMDDIPKLKLPDNQEAYIENTTEAEAREMALMAAQVVEADFFYAAPVAGGGFVYLAIFDLVFKSKIQVIDPKEVEENLIQYIHTKSIRLSEITDFEEQKILLATFIEDFESQLHHNLKKIKNIEKYTHILDTLKNLIQENFPTQKISQALVDIGKKLN